MWSVLTFLTFLAPCWRRPCQSLRVSAYNVSVDGGSDPLLQVPRRTQKVAFCTRERLLCLFCGFSDVSFSPF